MRAKKPCSLDSSRRMKKAVRQTVSPLVSKTAGELRSPHLSQIPASDPVQSHGHRALGPERPHSKEGNRRPPFLQKDLVMDGCFVGVDVSKNQLDGCIDQQRSFQHPNTGAGIAQVVKLLKATAPVAVVVVEATGGLEVPLVRALQKASIPVAVVNPRAARDFAKASGRLAKTDKIDAEGLAHFAKAMTPKPQALPDEQTEVLDALVTRRCQLIDMRTMESNREKQTADAKVRVNIEKHVEWLDENIGDADRQIGELVKNNPQWQAVDKLQQSVPGIGKGVSRALLAGLPEMGKVGSRTLAALVGLAPFARDSGKYRGKRHIAGGRSHVRSVLYMGAMTAARSQTHLGDFYRRLRANGKGAKVAMVAVAHKMLTIVNAVVRTGKAYEDALHGPRPAMTN